MDTIKNNNWPSLDYNSYKKTIETVQLWSQIVGKIRLSNMPWLNHSWHVTLYVSATGLTTGGVPYNSGIFQIDFNFIEHNLTLSTSTGQIKIMQLYERTVADFYKELLEKLKEAGVQTSIYAVPNEVEPAFPFEKDTVHTSYDKEQMQNYWLALVKVHPVFLRFRAGFTGKCSPVHLFWGAFDLAVTRFSGRRAPAYSGNVLNIPLNVMKEAYSHEVSSCGFWPGSEQFPQAVFYAYCYPAQEEYGNQPVSPSAAFYSKDMGEFFLPYEAVQQSQDPEKTLLSFLETTYSAASKTAHWEGQSLECDLTRFEE